MTKHTKLYLSILSTWLILAIISSYLIFKIDTDKNKSTQLLQQSITQEAIAHFNNMLDTRKWNASHGGVYVKKHDNLQANPYLQNNTLKTDTNGTLIKINPAWMTRQISEIANVDNNYYYKITSLKPINPDNRADSFEKEALEYFEKNRNTDYYYIFPQAQDAKSKFDFMGKLNVTQKCMQCHEYQGYKVGDIRGGIRVSIPTKIYNNAIKVVGKKVQERKYKTILAAFIIAFLITVYLTKSFSYTHKIEKLNEELEEKVRLRTKELQEINETLEERVSTEVQKNREKDEAMLSQSKQVAMGEMIKMLAHQWRQPIANISMQANNVLVDIELGAEDTKEMVSELESISNETQELSQMISSLSEMFESTDNKKLLKVQDIIQETLSMLSGSFQAYNINIETIYKDETKIEILSQALFQICLNILLNAKDILDERKVTNPIIKIETLESESEIIIKISDNGGGIEGEKYDRIFEPYYSTHKELNGKGLGLYTSHMIATKELHGSIDVHNNPLGAEFMIKIPKQ